MPPWAGEGVVVFALFAFALVVRQVVYVAFFTDSISYLGFARNILDGRHHGIGITSSRFLYPPLYPHLVALLSGGNPDPLHLAEIGRRVSVFAGALTVVPVYVLTRRMFGYRAALIAGLLVTLTPEFLYYSGAVLTESAATLFIAVGLLLLWESGSNGYTRPVLPVVLGAVLGLAFLTRHASIGFLFLSIVWIVVGRRRSNDERNRKGLTRRFIPVILVLAGFTAAVSPQVLYLRSETGIWTLTGNFLTDPSKAWQYAGADQRYTEYAELGASLSPDGRHFAFEDNPPTKPSDMVRTLWRRPLGFLKSYFRTVFGGYLPDTRPLPYPGIVLGLSLLGTVLLLARAKFREMGFLVLVFGGFYLFLALFHNIRDRYMFPVFPVLLILAGAGVSLLIDMITSESNAACPLWRRKPVLLGGLVLLIFGGLLPSGIGLVSDVNSGYNIGYYRAMGEELSGKIEEGSLVFDRMPHRAYFAGSEAVRVPYAPVDDVVRFGRHRGVRYWIVSSDYVPALRPQFDRLLRDPGPYKEDLRPLEVYGEGDQRTILFEIIPKDPDG